MEGMHVHVSVLITFGFLILNTLIHSVNGFNFGMCFVDWVVWIVLLYVLY